MRYIDKSNPCVEFEEFLQKFGQRLHGDWEKLKKITEKNNIGERIAIGRNILLSLFKHLRNEQKCLCIYCQQMIPEKTEGNADTYKFAHLEHVKKRALHKDLIFNQKNLTVSCNGFDTEITKLEDNAEINEFCGHFKDNDKKDKNGKRYNETIFDANLFLNPLEWKTIESYFEYQFSDDDTQIYIVPNQNCFKEQRQKAEFTIKILGLQHPKLCEMRRRQYEIIVESVVNGKNINDLLSTDYDELPAFYSMLKEKFL